MAPNPYGKPNYGHTGATKGVQMHAGRRLDDLQATPRNVQQVGSMSNQHPKYPQPQEHKFKSSDAILKQAVSNASYFPQDASNQSSNALLFRHLLASQRTIGGCEVRLCTKAMHSDSDCSVGRVGFIHHQQSPSAAAHLAQPRLDSDHHGGHVGLVSSSLSGLSA